jgi:hypothetical protein
MDYSKFLKDIMSVSSSFREKDSNGKKIRDMQQGIINGFLEKMPEEHRATAKAFMEEKNFNERIDTLMNIEGFDYPQFLEKTLDQFFNSGETFSHNGFNLDPKKLQKTYESCKQKFKKYTESEDINNF